MKDKSTTEASRLLQAFNQRLIFDALSRFDGSIILVWDRFLMKQLNIIVSTKELAKFNVIKNLSLENKHTNVSEASYVLYLVAPALQSVDKLLTNYLSALPEHDSRQHHIFFVPEPTYILTERLKADKKVWSRVTSCSSLPVYWYPTEHSHFLTLLQPQLPNQMLINGDWNALYKCAVALNQLVGGVNRVSMLRCRGDWSARILEIMRRLPTIPDETGKDSDAGSGAARESASNQFPIEIENLVLIDRWFDPLTPLLNQFTFGGAIDEIFGIDVQGITKVPLGDNVPIGIDAEEPSTSARDAHQAGKKTKDIELTGDEVYSVLQDLHVNAIPGKLKEFIKQLCEEEGQMRALSQIDEFKQYVPKIPLLKRKRESTACFLEVAEEIQHRHAEDVFQDVKECVQEILMGTSRGDHVLPFIEESLIQANLPAETVLRLIAIQSLASKGLRPTVLNTYLRLFIQSYGVFNLKWFLRLQIAGLITDDGSENRVEATYPNANYPHLSKRYRLIVPGAETNELYQRDASYAWNGRASLLVRFLEEALQNNFREFTTIKTETLSANAIVSLNGARQKTKSLTALFVVGGLTRAEISVIRQLSNDSQQNNTGGFAVIASTAIVNARSILNQFKN